MKVLITLILFSFISVSVEAGLLRPGKVFPLWRDRPGYDEPNQPSPNTPPTPLPPPIIDPSLKPTIPQVNNDDIEKVIAALSDSTDNSNSSKYPPWLPLGGLAGGGLLSLLGIARKNISLIKG